MEKKETLADKIEEGKKDFRSSALSTLVSGFSFFTWDKLNRLLLDWYKHPEIASQYGNQAQDAHKILVGMTFGLGALAVGSSIYAVAKYLKANNLYEEIKREKEQTRVHYPW